MKEVILVEFIYFTEANLSKGSSIQCGINIKNMNEVFHVLPLFGTLSEVRVSRPLTGHLGLDWPRFKCSAAAGGHGAVVDRAALDHL